ncbi:MAG: CMP-N-acetylneuraminic acid synthetase [Crocinitomicaceae bacterium]|jgi:N-acylneuraminate cytidylyltransferase|nr:CMP-N-acetylneuraminic acid synthetase [Crocinitomicaceae bacterium]
MKNLAVITARGGSKRIPRKNIRDFCGMPIIAYPIKAALDSGLFDEVMVSTDDAEIAEIAREYGAKVPFMRSPANSDDFSGTAEVLLEVLAEYTKEGKHFDTVCCIYPTAPFVNPEKLQEAFRMLREKKADAVLPITAFSFPIWRSFKLENDKVAYNWEEFAPKRSQDLPKAYHDCGQFYFLDCEKFIQSRKMVPENTCGIEVPETEVQDIDEETDWKIAELKYLLFKEGAK